jgi:Immunoglobulin-like domain of bacterial spore germination
MSRGRFALLACVLVAGCGGSETSVETTAPPSTTATPVTTQAAPETSALRLYFLQDGKLAATSRRVVRTRAVGRAALDALAAGPTEAERGAGFTTACSTSELSAVELTIADGEASLVPPLAGDCADQAAWTLLQFPTVTRVDGAERADLERRAPAILVDSPVPFEAVSSPLRVSGTANTYEATFEYDLRDDAGKTLAHHFVTATSGNGTRGTFDFTIPFELDRAVDGALVVYESSAEDGSQINIRRIPLRLLPS